VQIIYGIFAGWLISAGDGRLTDYFHFYVGNEKGRAIDDPASHGLTS
jgi:hypothetical protein